MLGCRSSPAARSARGSAPPTWEPLLGEQAQIDWAHVGKVPVQGGERALWLFVMVLSYSRALWAEFVFDLSASSLCRSLVRASHFFGGMTRQWLFDNPKTVVLERQGDAVRYHPQLLDLCAKLHVQTMLAKILGHEALLAGFTVRFITLAAALADLLQQESLPAFERRIKRYLQPQLLILDELGYLPCDSRAADLLYNVISRRHEHRSTIITTNLAFKQWGTVFPGAACVGALVDRFAQHCHCIEIDADSWRNRHGIERDQAPASPSPVKPR